ncbi:MAG: serine O-acetyltransferase [Saprospiraceae bacterium]|nr:serine O-acetyltransferase [Saprospiraceae bacterium]
MDSQFKQLLLDDHTSCSTCPAPSSVGQFFEGLLQLLFADLAEEKLTSAAAVQARWVQLQSELNQVLQYQYEEEDAQRQTMSFFDQLPILRKRLLQDAQAIEKGDPAAESLGEVIRTYPGFFAIAAHRVAHALWASQVRTIPRMIAEIAHTRTGVDIHPGATIGDHFCIDHGTGVVIGATSLIGDHVKVYQGVTLGALSVRKEDASKKRHPTIEDHCILYAGATILGGKTVIGQGSIIGGNVWITKSVPANSKIYYQAKIHDGQAKDADFVLFKNEV